MAPRTSGPSALNGLTKIEEVVMRAAARLLTALEYREENPGGDFQHYLERIPLELELVSKMFQLAETRLETRLRFQTTPHPVLTIVGQLWRDAADEGRHPRLEDISLADIRKTCATMAKKHPDKPSVFFAKDLSRLAYALPRTDHWWLPPSDVGRRSQGLSNKRKVPKALMDIDSPSATKRSASLVAQAEEQVDNKKNKDGKSKANPQKAGTAVSRRIVQVVIQSPKIAPQRRKRRRVEEDVESQKRDSEERDEETSVEPWVGKGQDRCERCRKLNLPACEPQWQAKRPFNSCKACARSKLACKPTKIWKEKVAVSNQELVWLRGPSQAGIEAASGRRQGRRLKVAKTAPPAVIIDTPVITIQAQVITAINARLQVMDQGIKEEISDLKTCIEGHSASLATLEP